MPIDSQERHCEESTYQTGDTTKGARLRALCRMRLEDIATLARWIEPHDSSWTDDATSTTVTTTLDEGGVFRASSTAQQGESLVDDILRGTLSEIRSELHGIAAEGLLGDRLAGIREQLEVEESGLASVPSIEIRDSVDPDGRWHGNLRTPEMPTNLDFEASIQRHGTPGVSQLSRELQSQWRALEDVAWLWRAVAEYPNVHFGIRYVDGRSLSPTAEASLRRDLEATNPELLDRLTPAEISSALLVTTSIPRTKTADCGYSRWLVLRTGESVLWQFAGNDPVRLHIHPIPAANCALRPAGILIDPSGRPVPREQPRRSALGSP